MNRTFKQFTHRRVLSLDGTWTYVFPSGGTEIRATDWDQGTKVALPVPGVWEMLDERKNYRGQALARTTVRLEKPGWLQLHFKGVSHSAWVFLDGREIGFHHNGYTSFSMDAGHMEAGDHALLLRITNEFNTFSALHVANDYYSYGGISRPVEAHLLETPLSIGYLHCQTRAQGGHWQLSVAATCSNRSDERQTAELTVEVPGQVLQQEVILEPGETVARLEATVREVKAWTPEKPELYLIHGLLRKKGMIVDDRVERIGFREISIRGEDICLNGKRIFPMGFNRHEDHPVYGCAIPVDQMRQDLALMKEMHANAVRTSHYPNDERFLDLCDEMGFLVWEEHHARCLPLGPRMHPNLEQQLAGCNAEMVREHYNHPCIFVWGVLNECDSAHEHGAAIYRKQFEQLAALDATRPRTFASCQHEGDLCQGLVDICSWNIYPGWYTNEPAAAYVEGCIRKHEPEGMKGKPLIFSEFGAGALPGFHDPARRPKWSEERQSDILDEQLQVILNHPRVGGAFIWQFCDVRVDERLFGGRPRCMNNKGVVDERRNRKLGFEVVKKHFLKKQPSTGL